MIPPVDMGKLLQLHAQVERHGVRYGLGAKAPGLGVGPGGFSAIDCSGYVRWLLFNASGGKLTVPDGSQNQRVWAESNLRQVDYRDAVRFMTDNRLFIAFIRTGFNGAGAIGHVFLLASLRDHDGVAETIESHGGHGPNSRPWNTGVLLREVFSCFELPAIG